MVLAAEVDRRVDASLLLQQGAHGAQHSPRSEMISAIGEEHKLPNPCHVEGAPENEMLQALDSIGRRLLKDLAQARVPHTIVADVVAEAVDRQGGESQLRVRVEPRARLPRPLWKKLLLLASIKTTLWSTECLVVGRPPGARSNTGRLRATRKSLFARCFACWTTGRRSTTT
jgi:hypothetical protein